MQRDGGREVAERRDRVYSDAVFPQPARHSGSENRRSSDGTVLAILRVYRRVSQKELGRRTGIHHVTISQYERGERSVSERQRLLEGLELPESAWESVQSVVEWLDWLAQRYEPEQAESGGAGETATGRRPDGLADLSEPSARRREANRLAETAGRERQRQVAEVLDFLIALNS